MIPKFTVGDIEIYPVMQLHHVMTPEKLLGIDAQTINTELWCWRKPFYVAEDRLLTVDMGGYLVRTPTHQVLIDLGVGNDKTRLFATNLHQRHDNWLGKLAALGVRPENIDAIVITHFHVDHVGYATVLVNGDWTIAFPGVPHYAGKGELEFWRDDRAGAQRARMGDYMVDSVMPVENAGLIQYVDTGFEVVPGLTIEAHPGHTPGTIAAVAESKGKGAIFVGDIVHHASQLRDPAQNTTYCIDPAAAVAARHEILERVTDTDWLLIPAHFPGTLPGRVARDGTGYRWIEVDESSAESIP